jgi:hydroxylamine dehydrogenase
VAQNFIKRGYEKIYALAGGYREWARAQYPLEARVAAGLACVDCHKDVTPRIVSDYKLSTMSRNEVSCSTCHGDHHKTGDDISKVQPFDPKVCGLCHEKKWKQFNAGKHANAWAAMKALPYGHSQTVAVREGMKGCESCHRLGVKTETEIAALKQEGKVFGLASCNGCHTRHTFSVSEARQPQACQTCHTGSEHPQWEMYSGSKHGAKYLLAQLGKLPETTAAPTCQTCHMPKGNHKVRAPWGFYGVRLPLPEDKPWAAARATILKSLGVLNPGGNETPRFDVFRTSDVMRMTEQSWEESRIDLMRTCTQCPSTRFSEDELAKGDKMIREADLLLAEAVGIVAGLYADKILEKPKNDAYAYPDLLVRNEAPTPIEQKLYVMFIEHRMKAFQGSFHFNPDYALWSGWNELQRDLIEIKSMAEALRAEALRAEALRAEALRRNKR